MTLPFSPSVASDAAAAELARFAVRSSQMSLVPTTLANSPLRRLNFEDCAQWVFHGPASDSEAAAQIAQKMAPLWARAVAEQKGAVTEKAHAPEAAKTAGERRSFGLSVSWLGATPFEVWEEIAEKIGAQIAEEWTRGRPDRCVALSVAREPGLTLWIGPPAPAPHAAPLAEGEFGQSDRLSRQKLLALHFFGCSEDDGLPDAQPAACLLLGPAALELAMQRWVQDGRRLALADAEGDPELAEVLGPFSQRAWLPAALAKAPIWAARQTAPKFPEGQRPVFKFAGALSTRPYPWRASVRCPLPARDARQWALALSAVFGPDSLLAPADREPAESFSDALALWSELSAPIAQAPLR